MCMIFFRFFFRVGRCGFRYGEFEGNLWGLVWMIFFCEVSFCDDLGNMVDG